MTGNAEETNVEPSLDERFETLQDELDDLDFFEAGTTDEGSGDEESSEEPSAEQEIEEPAAEEPTSETQTEEEEAPAETPSATEQPQEDAHEEQLSDNTLVEQIEKLSQKILDLEGQLAQRPKEEAPSEDSQEQQTPTAALDEADFVGDLDIDDVAGSKEVFNQVLHKFGQHLMNSALKNTLLAIPDVVVKQIGHQTAVKKLTDDFYDANNECHLTGNKL